MNSKDWNALKLLVYQITAAAGVYVGVTSLGSSDLDRTAFYFGLATFATIGALWTFVDMLQDAIKNSRKE